MWSSQHHEETDADPQVVWDLVVGVHSGERKVAGHEAYAAEAPLAIGSVVRAVDDSFVGPDMRVVEYAPARRYAHEFSIRRYTVRLGYTIEALDEGGTRLVRTIGINGPFADLAMAGLGQHLSAVYTPQVRALLKEARSGSAS